MNISSQSKFKRLNTFGDERGSDASFFLREKMDRNKCAISHIWGLSSYIDCIYIIIMIQYIAYVIDKMT